MYHRWAALALVLALCAVPTKQAAGQDTSTPPRGRKQLGVLGQNYPNPFNPVTHIPFSVIGCEGSVSQHVVSVRIYNVLAQLVAVPHLEGVAGPDQPLQNLTLPCGNYTAFWDGKVLNSGREAASGVYLYELVVDGTRLQKKAFVAK
jgi:hypothetical protein